MKKILLFTFISLLIISAGVNVNAQSVVPHGDFDSWDPFASFSDDGAPVGWFADNDYADGIHVVQPTTPSYSGANAAMITTFYDNVMLHTTFSGLIFTGFPYTSRPSNLLGYMKVHMQANDSAFIVVFFKGAASDSIGAGFSVITSASNVNSYTSFSIPITYLNNHTIDSAFIYVKVGTTTPHFFDNVDKSGDTLIIDALSFPLATGMNESVYTASLTAYPNPASDYITFNASYFTAGEKLTVSVINILGEKTSVPFKWRGEDATVYIGNLPKGIYFMEAAGEKSKTVQRFVKE